MELRPFGRTGVSVSELCLGAMMFGDWGTRTTMTASASSTGRWTPGSTSSTPRTFSPGRVGGHRRQGAGAHPDRIAKAPIARGRGRAGKVLGVSGPAESATTGSRNLAHDQVVRVLDHVADDLVG